jgi:membrane protein DedA with SNARE-associated domain
MTFLAVALGSLLGSFLGNIGVFWAIGAMAKRQEKKQLEELQKLQQGYLEMAERERTRMENYAKMEG